MAWIREKKIKYCKECGKQITALSFCDRTCSAQFRSKNKNLISEEELIELYTNQKLELAKIAEIKKCSVCTVCKYVNKYKIKKRGCGNFIDYTNQKIGKILCIEPIFPEKSGVHVSWKCKCDCGNEFTAISTSLTNRKYMECQKCSRIRTRDPQELKDYFWAAIQRCNNSRPNPFEFSITKDYAYKIFLEQDKKCALSGVQLSFGKTCRDKTETTASLDRIDSSKGYIEGNIQWVHKRINIMKSTDDDSDFIEWCKKVTDYNKSIGE